MTLPTFRHPINRRAFLAFAVIFLLVGFGLRLSVYNFFGLDGDDGFSLSVSTNNDVPTLVRELMAQRLDIHPPLHFLMLKGWVAVAGQSLLSLRLMNILIDVLMGAMMIRLATRAFGRRTGLFAAVLWLLAPLIIYTDNLIRMYMLVTALILAGMLCVVEGGFARGSRRQRWYAMGAFWGLAAIYTHIIGALALLVLGLGALLGSLRTGWRTVLTAVGWFILAGLLSLVYTWPTWILFRSGRQLGAQVNFSGFANPLEAVGAILNTLFVHRLVDNWPWPGLLVLMALALVSYLYLRRRGGAVWPVLALAWGSLAAMTAMAYGAKLFRPYYIVPFAPIVLILLASMLGYFQRLGSVLLVFCLLIGQQGILGDLDHSLRDDWTAATEFIETHEQPGDKVIIVPDWATDAFRYHYHGHSEVVFLFSHVSPEVDVNKYVDFVVREQRRVWFVLYQADVSDPQDLVDNWLRSHAATMTEVYPRSIRLKLYDFAPRFTALPPTASPLNLPIGDVALLKGVTLPMTSGSARDTRLHPPSNWIQISLFWEVLKSGSAFVPRVHLIDADEQVWGGSWDRENSVLRRVPSTQWQPGQIWRTTYDVNLNPVTPPGIYRLVVGLADPATGELLRSAGPGSPELPEVEVGQFTVR